MADFHWLRPLWLLAFIPLVLLIWLLFKRNAVLSVWEAVCDKHLLTQLIINTSQNRKNSALFLLAISAFFIIVALAGPAWERLPVSTFKMVKPKILLLDMSESMLANDLPPDRLNRAKFKLHDLFNQKSTGQFGLIVFSGEPFVISPLTEDSQTIDALLSSLTPEIMPVGGNRLDPALEEAAKLFQQSGFYQGDILVLTATPPSQEAIVTASSLASEGYKISVLPILKDKPSPSFQEFAQAGKGHLLNFSDDSTDLNQWLNSSTKEQYKESPQEIAVWRDEGRWFLIPALLFLLPVFRRGWLQKVLQ